MQIKGKSNSMKKKQSCNVDLSVSQSIVSDMESPENMIEHPNSASNVNKKRLIKGHESGFQLTK